MTITLSGCASGYSLVKPSQATAGGPGMLVTPDTAWNKMPAAPDLSKWEEAWTENGPLLDTVRFVAGLPDGEALVKQQKKADRKVPVFRSNMNPQDLVSMIESYYRVRGGITVFKTTGLEPVSFLGKQGVKFDYEYTVPNGQQYMGRSVLAVVSGKLYLIGLDATKNHYFQASLKPFETIVASATVK